MSRDMEIFLAGRLKGAKATRQRHLDQADAIQRVISHRWNKRDPKQWQVKHLRWYLHEHLKDTSGHTRYRYWLTIELIAQRLGKFEDWRSHLRGPWTTPPEKSRQ